MRIFKRMAMRSATALAAGLLAALVAGTALAAEEVSREQAARLESLGAKVFGIKWSAPVRGAAERGVTAVTDGRTTLTARGDRIFIVHDKKATAVKDKDAFTGSDSDLKRRAERILEGVGVKRAEIQEAKVLQQMTQTALREPKARPKVGKAQKGRRTLLVTRQIAGIPVLSSRLVLDLNGKGEVAFMELAWPEIKPEVVESARRLQVMARENFRPPQVPGATVESVRAVVLHSPAVGFFDDQTAALQVVYRPEKPEMGKKPVRYLDAEGHDVPLPRQIEPLREEKLTR